MHVEIEVEAAVVVDREVAEQVDALYRRVRQRVEEGLPRRAPVGEIWGRYGGDIGEIYGRYRGDTGERRWATLAHEGHEGDIGEI